MRKILFITCIVCAVSAIPPAFAIKYEFHGDFNNRFQFYGNQQGFMNLNGANPVLDDAEDNFAEIKYRLWTIASNDDDSVKAVFAAEIGGIRFGEGNEGDFSGDGNDDFEVRWAYTDFALADGRVKIGLQPFKVNTYLWSETVPAVWWESKQEAYSYVLAWARGEEYFQRGPDADFTDDNDNLLARIDFEPAEGTKTGLFALYQNASPSSGGGGDLGELDSRRWRLKQFGDNIDYDIISLGVDGGWKQDDVFIDWDVFWQGGSMDNVAFTDQDGVTGPNTDHDVNAFFGRAKVGTSVGPTTVSYMFYYASGDDDPNDDEFNAFLTTDVDIFDSATIQEGSYVDDSYHTESPYLLDKGMIMNSFNVDHKVSDKTKVGGALMYMLTAEDITYTNQDTNQSFADNAIGFEVMGYVSYKIYENLELALKAAYLASGDAMDFYEDIREEGSIDTRDGSADEDIVRVSARARYKF